MILSLSPTSIAVCDTTNTGVNITGNEVSTGAGVGILN